MRRLILILLAMGPFATCNAAQNGAQAASFTALSTKPAPAASAARAGKSARKARYKDAGRYFVEFRSRYALSYGHTFLVHGRLNSKGEVGELSAKNVAGFHPVGETPEFWMLGHLVPVPAETGPSDGDTEEEYVSARYRVYLSEGEYAKVAAYIKEKQSSKALWHAGLYNCNLWVGEVARFLGLKAPVNHVQYPADYINEMRALNTAADGPEVAGRLGGAEAAAQ
jgi:hypothetical protein